MNTKSKFNLSMKAVALGTGGLLLIPFVAMQVTTTMVWSLFDFALLGALIFTAGMVIRFLFNQAGHLAFRLASVAAVGSTLLLIWVNLAVGLIGSGGHGGNLMYIAVVAVALVGAALAQFRARGMELAMYATSFSLVLLTAVALVAGMQEYPGSSIQEIVGVNGFFALQYGVAALLFRRAAQDEKTANGHA